MDALTPMQLHLLGDPSWRTANTRTWLFTLPVRLGGRALTLQGYLPGQLAGLPRLPGPRLKVAAESVGITGRQTGIYQGSSPRRLEYRGAARPMRDPPYTAH